jgi:beta-glucanase (GH16 family)
VNRDPSLAAWRFCLETLPHLVRPAILAAVCGLFVGTAPLFAAGQPQDKGWTLEGPLGDTPRRTSEAAPLSDQQNAGDWKPYDVMTDEFEGDHLDSEKWWPKHPTWQGRQPALFYPGNVSVSDGKLHLAMKKEEAPQMPREKGYHDYTSATVHSKTKVLYGYFEVEARPMRSAGSSSFWFAGHGDGWRTEIDVFEIGGRAAGFERKYNMNLHVFYTPEENRHWSLGGKWIAPWDLDADYHVYGLEWDAERIGYYVDGVLVREVKNTHWHQPLYLIFDSETMPDWFGMPKDEDLPSTYSIEYVRAWKK